MPFSAKPATALGIPTVVALYAMIAAFMALSLAVTATGTARFAVAIGCLTHRRARTTHERRYCPEAGSADAGAADQ